MNGPLRICLVSAAYHPYPSGVSEHVSQLGASLQRLGHKVEVLTTRFSGFHDDSAEAFPVTRFGRALLVPMNGSYATLPVGLKMARQVRNFLGDRSLDIVHCHGMFWPEISYWAIRYSQSVNVVSFLTAGFSTGSRGGRTYQWLFRNHLRKIHGRVPVSNRAREAFEAYIPGDCRIIPCGVDLTRFRPDAAPIAEQKPGSPTILFLGRLDARKGIRILIRAMPNVLARLPDARLLVVGTGPEAASSERLARKLGVATAIEFVGRADRQDIASYYAGCDIYCAPTLGGETLGIVLLEAMAAGKPIVSTDIPGYDETARADVDALLCRPGNSHALAAAIVQIAQDSELRNRLIGGGLSRAQQYSWPSIARRTADYYRELLENRA
ncbi:MAG: glycosyltransferase family 4 protein [candidate division WOR-3 bacterium]|nr:MAG: glycosyltransferase family 4 protein [candidate division WOR-3 bacterium]